MISVVLVEPESAGNVGSVARSMKNFELENLYLINPKCNHLSSEAFKMAMHGAPVLKSAKIIDNLESFDYCVATSSRPATDYNLNRSFIFPDIFAKKISRRKGNIALIFGRESTGLTNSEISMCDVVVKIPSSSEYPALNLANSAAIIFYELYKQRSKQIVPVLSGEEKKALFSVIDASASGKKGNIHKKLWRRIIGKALLTRREAFSLMGFFRK